MRVHLLFAVAFIACAAPAHAAEPVTVQLRETATVGTSVVVLGDVALISGGSDAARAKLARIDLAELKPRESSVIVGRRSVEYRLILAGFETTAVRVVGAERATISLAKRTVSVEEVTAAAKAELVRHLTATPDSVAIQLARPVLVKMPELPTDERPTITAKPHGRVTSPGRVQMDVSISSNTAPLLSFAMYFDVNPAVITPAAGMSPAVPAPVSSEVIIRPRQRVTMEVHSGGLTVKTTGEAQQEGRLGQSILVQNVSSKKTVVARVTGPATVEVDIGGSP